MTRLTPKDVQQFYEQLSGSLASGRVRRIHTTLHGALKAAQQAYLIASNPTEQIIAPKFSYGEKQILMDEQLYVFMKIIVEDEIWCDLCIILTSMIRFVMRCLIHPFLQL